MSQGSDTNENHQEVDETAFVANTQVPDISIEYETIGCNMENNGPCENVSDDRLCCELYGENIDCNKSDSDESDPNSLFQAESMSSESDPCTIDSSQPNGSLVRAIIMKDALLAENRAKLEMYKTRVNRLEIQLKLRQQSVEKQRKLVNEKECKLNDCMQQCHLQRDFGSQMKMELESAKVCISQLENELKDSQTVIDEQNKLAKANEQEFKLIVDSCDEYCLKAEQYQSEWLTAKSIINRLENELKQSLDETNKLISEQERQFKEISDVCDEHRMKIEQYSQYKDKWESAESRNNLLATEMKQNQESVDEQNKLLMKVELQLKEVTEKCNKYCEKYSESQAKLEAEESLVDHLKNEIKRIETLFREHCKLDSEEDGQLKRFADNRRKIEEELRTILESADIELTESENAINELLLGDLSDPNKSQPITTVSVSDANSENTQEKTTKSEKVPNAPENDSISDEKAIEPEQSPNRVNENAANSGPAVERQIPIKLIYSHDTNGQKSNNKNSADSQQNSKIIEGGMRASFIHIKNEIMRNNFSEILQIILSLWRDQTKRLGMKCRSEMKAWE